LLCARPRCGVPQKELSDAKQFAENAEHFGVYRKWQTKQIDDEIGDELKSLSLVRALSFDSALCCRLLVVVPLCTAHSVLTLHIRVRLRRVACCV
jgi:hypothetical protein